MVRFEGDRDFRQPPDELFRRLTDLSFLVECVPDVEQVRSVSADHAELVLRPGFSFVRGALEVSMRLVEKTEPSAARVQLTSRGIGSSSEVEATLALTPREAGTAVHWVAEVKSLGGLLKMVPAGLIRGAAEKVLQDAWNQIAAKLD